MPLTTGQVEIIKATVPVIRKHGNTVTTVFYDHLLTDAPQLNDIFNTANQKTGHQATALAGALYAYAANIDRLGKLGPALDRICQKHASLHIQPDQYDVVGTYLLRAMGEVLEGAFTPEIHDAWAAAYKQLANIMIERESHLTGPAQSQGWTNWRDFTISDRVHEAEDIDSFYLTPTDGRPLPSYKPGQYISIRTTVPTLDHLQSRQYSLSGRPTPTYYRITVKREAGLDTAHPTAPAHPGYVSTVLHTSKRVGDTLQVSHPYGDFYLDASPSSPLTHPIVLISAGVGVTPLLAILDTLAAQHHSAPVSWIHAARSSRVLAFGSHIADIARANPNVRTRVFVKEPGEGETDGFDFVGRLDLGKLSQEKDLFVGDPTAEYYVCGPEGFMKDVRGVLNGYGVDAGRIKLETFGTGGVEME